MPNYVITYHRPQHELGVAAVSAGEWMRWFEGIGDHLIEMGAPVGAVRRLGSSEGERVVSGYSIISASDLDEAAALAAGCPGLKQGFGLELGELLPVPSAA